MPKIVGILTFMSRMNFVLSGVQHGKSFITSGPGLTFLFACKGQVHIKADIYLDKSCIALGSMV